MPVSYRSRDEASPTPEHSIGRRRAKPQRSGPRKGFLSVIGSAALIVAGLGTLTINQDLGHGDLAAADYAGVNRTNAKDVSRSFDRAYARQAPQQAEQIQVALAQLNETTEAQAAERTDEKIRTQWVLPVAGYQLTARFGAGGGRWSSGRHTGLDFAGPSGSTLVAIAAGTITKTGYEGAYGNKTVLTLEDGTEIWYAHQSSVTASVGQQVRPGDVIGYTGSTGNVTGPHLHLEVRPGGGDPIDPVAALQAHNVNP